MAGAADRACWTTSKPQRRKARERLLLEAAEYDRLVAAGVPKRAARRGPSRPPPPCWNRRASSASPPSRPGQSVANAVRRHGLPPAPPAQHRRRAARRTHARRPLRLAVGLELGKPVRAVLAALLVAACGTWAIQNDLLNVTGRGDAEVLPLTLPGLPPEWTEWCDTVNAGWGGILLLVSLLYRGHRSAALTLLGTAVVVVGHKFGIRTVHPVQDYHVSMFLGTVLAMVGWRLGRR